jgi:S1-C subfamily serine protease
MKPGVWRLLPVLLLFFLAGPQEARGEDGPFAEFNHRARRIVDSVTPALVQVVRESPSLSSNGSDPPAHMIGTGIALEGNYVLTSASVVGPETEVEVRRNGISMVARVVGVDRRTNVAILEVPGLDLEPLPVAENSLLFPGRMVIAVGLGPEDGPDASFGTVIVNDGPNLGFTDVDMVQVTAPAYPGITGGVLLNTDGEMVGMISGHMKLDSDHAILPEGSNLVAGFYEDGHLNTRDSDHATLAVPISVALEISKDLLDDGTVQRGYLGVQVELVQVGSRNSESHPGVMVHHLVNDGPADDAGLIPGDVILNYAHAKVTSPEDLSYLVAATQPGSTVPIIYLRRGSKGTALLNIEQAPGLPWEPGRDALISVNQYQDNLAPRSR